MGQSDSGQRFLYQQVDVIARTNLDQVRHSPNQFRLTSSGAYRKVHAGVLQVFVLIDRAGVDVGLYQLERQRDEVRRHDGLEQHDQLFVKVGEARAQVLVVVGR